MTDGAMGGKRDGRRPPLCRMSVLVGCGMWGGALAAMLVASCNGLWPRRTAGAAEGLNRQPQQRGRRRKGRPLAMPCSCVSCGAPG